LKTNHISIVSIADEQNIKGKKTNVGTKQSSSTNKASPSAVAKSQEKNQDKTQTKRKGAAKGKAKAKAKAMLSDSDGLFSFLLMSFKTIIIIWCRELQCRRNCPGRKVDCTTEIWIRKERTCKTEESLSQTAQR
jgi:hypothetical protein